MEFNNNNFKKIIILALLVFFSYLPALKAGFVWDDIVVTSNMVIKAHDGLWKIWSQPSSIYLESHYWPVVYSSFWIEYHLWGMNPSAFHLDNILLHALNTILLFFILSRLSIPGAWLASAIFALHPVHVESVAWIIERKDLLSGLFYLLAFLTYIHFEYKKNPNIYVISLACFILGILSKSIVVTLPVVMVLYLVWEKESLNKSDFIPLISYFVIAIIFSFFDIFISRQAVSIHFNISFLGRVLIASRALWFYVEKFFVPINLIPIYPRWNIHESILISWISFFGFILILTFLWFQRKKIGKGPLVIVLFFIVTLAPVLGFIDFSYMGYSFVADRFQYLVSIGLCVVVSGFLIKIMNKIRSNNQFIQGVFLSLLLLFLGFLTWSQTRIYKDDETLFRYILTKNPNSWAAYNNLGNAQLQQGKVKDAYENFSHALELMPSYAEAHNNLAVVLEKEGKIEEATEHYKKAVKYRQNYAEAYNNLGYILAKQGKIDLALENYRTALRIKQDYAAAFFNLAVALSQQGKVNEAIEAYLNALRYKSDFAEAHNNLAVLLLNQGKFEDAISHYQAALLIKPDFAEACFNLGIAYTHAGRLEDAIAQFSKALKINPDYKQAKENLEGLLEAKKMHEKH